MREDEMYSLHISFLDVEFIKCYLDDLFVGCNKNVEEAIKGFLIGMRPVGRSKYSIFLSVRIIEDDALTSWPQALNQHHLWIQAGNPE